MSQLEKLKALQESKSKTANLSLFSNLVVIDVGIKPTQHFPKLKDEFGNKLKDENGKDKRSETSDGFTYTFTEFGTGKIVKIVPRPSRGLETGKLFRLVLQDRGKLDSWVLIKSLVLAMISSQQI